MELCYSLRDPLCLSVSLSHTHTLSITLSFSHTLSIFHTHSHFLSPSHSNFHLNHASSSHTLSTSLTILFLYILISSICHSVALSLPLHRPLTQTLSLHWFTLSFICLHYTRSQSQEPGPVGDGPDLPGPGDKSQPINRPWMGDSPPAPPTETPPPPRPELAGMQRGRDTSLAFTQIL